MTICEKSKRFLRLNLKPGTRISLFDLDHTLLRVNSSFLFGKYLFHQGFFSAFEFLQLGSIYFFHKLNFLSLEAVHKFVFHKLFEGRSRIVFERHLEPFFDRYWHQMLYSPAIERLRAAQQRGHCVAILSSSPSFLVKEIAARLNVETYLASEYSVNDQQSFSHIGLLVQGEEKASWIDQVLLAQEIPQKHITAYTDSILDLPFLLKAGTVVAVGPDKKLRNLCRDNAWEII